MQETNTTGSEQEKFWTGAFGSEYTARNAVMPELRKPFWERIYGKLDGIGSVCELGANRGHNLAALKAIDSSVMLTGVEINADACKIMETIPGVHTVHSSILDFAPSERFDFVFTCGVLIHVDPNELHVFTAR